MTVEIFEDLARSPRGEVWYGVKVNGRDLQALWADPDAARRRGEAYARESRSRGGKMETTETETPTIPEPEPNEDAPETEPETPTTDPDDVPEDDDAAE